MSTPSATKPLATAQTGQILRRMRRTYADATEREAATDVAPGDAGLYALQRDDRSEWRWTGAAWEAASDIEDTISDAQAVGAAAYGAAVAAQGTADAAATDATAALQDASDAAEVGTAAYAAAGAVQTNLDTHTADTGNPHAVTKAQIGLGSVVNAGFGDTSGSYTEGDDSRLSNARTPTAHAASHAGGGLDAIALGAAGLLSGADKARIDSFPDPTTLSWSASLAIDPASGAHNPVISAGQKLYGPPPATTSSTPAVLSIYGQNGGSVSGDGGSIDISGGSAVGGGWGGYAWLYGGNAVGAGYSGGAVGGWAGISTDGIGGYVELVATAGYGTNRTGGFGRILGGNGIGSGNGGYCLNWAGDGGATGQGGQSGLQGGAGGVTSGQGGDSYAAAGAGRGSGAAGGNAYLKPGAPGAGGTPGQARMLDSSGAVKFACNTTGVGWFATAPVAKQTLTGSRAGNAAVASICTLLANYGLAVNSTTA